MKSLMYVGVPLVGVLLLGCASGDDTEPTPSREALAALCAGAPAANKDGTVTQSGCLFEQQLINMGRHGTQLETRALVDAEGQTIANVNLECSGWYSGTDATGVTVTIDSKSGEVRSHGAFHAGQSTSELAPAIATPLVLK